MAMQIGEEYQRKQIVEALGVSADQQERAVLLVSGKVAAIVIKQNGLNPFNGKHYVNARQGGTLVMQGENDDRGEMLENLKTPVRLFFSKNNNGRYRYEGMFEYVENMDVPGDPIRKFQAVP